ncbi:MAG: ABC transporter substrate-binding protein [Novosphingobium sp. 28-62-57]|uniref:thiamine pyrophosphate-dependent dehydrogenase E1 component subunit alpha n=1 Tax=unclassified Novosphingobium TaxID=2644732 RepID=UPI000BD16B0A|nr:MULTISPECIES: thiamine pyrophosphate-dependent dehydrogenase E1 component subunit alpha [unclassified Novosphingobium]OYW51511.1 MAG: ABC transporter substrate-binding protein [Novosphingobium sp. 12-62-10]OYZ10603.1 MAG: ABC transporter substrate-binding protein [Novosphingobium sp. 28-62-57]OZA40753.1 MAG: ABC transporter substrate-binding protein [Novosphingobium sp. 17-62-9]HQS68149.1 thiamine pyrophosphate-dependent dehydrogenase E1 component subunit alpha [Novosphingobium sp.]
MQLGHDQLLGAYRRMSTIRAFEERLHEEIKTGEIGGFTHLYCGQEAVAVGICDQLTVEDKIVSTHRGHGHCIAKGCDVRGMMLEIYGRAEGLCKGRAGSMHIADLDVGMLGANGIVGGGAPQAVGAALAAKMDGKGRVGIAFSGDGACNQGTTFEAMNMAVVTKAPAIFVFENNHYSEHTGVEYAVGTSLDIASRAEAFGMKVWRANGCDFFDTYEQFRDLLEYVRAGHGPAAIELDTERFYGHFEGDPQRYRGPGELDRIRDERDCLKAFRKTVTEAGLLAEAEMDAIDAEVHALIDAVVAEARAAADPDPATVADDVYAEYY